MGAFIDAFVDVYMELRESFFSPFITIAIFLFGVKIQLVLLLKDKIYDTPEWQWSQMRRREEFQDEKYSDVYIKLKRITRFFTIAERVAFFAAISQCIFPYIKWHNYFFVFTVACITCASFLVIAFCVILSGELFSSYIKGLKSPPDETIIRRYEESCRGNRSE